MTAVSESSDLVRRFQDARAASTPLISVATPDQFATMATLKAASNVAPVVSWNIASGFEHRNEAGLKALAAACGGKAALARSRCSNRLNCRRLIN